MSLSMVTFKKIEENAVLFLEFTNCYRLSKMVLVESEQKAFAYDISQKENSSLSSQPNMATKDFRQSNRHFTENFYSALLSVFYFVSVRFFLICGI